MSKVLIIGCGGVASVAIHKCCQVPEVFTEICIASRTKAKCDKLAAELAPTTTTKITTAQVDADKVEEVIALIKAYQPDLVMNIALPYQDLTIMDACLACGVNYMDTANYEPENTDAPEWRAIYEKRCKEAGFSAYFDYSWQWAYKKKFEDAGLFSHYAVRSTDIDLGHHMNNVAYVRLLLDCFSAKELASGNIQSVELHYSTPCFEGEALTVYKKSLDDGTCRIGIVKPDGKTASQACVTFKK